MAHRHPILLENRIQLVHILLHELGIDLVPHVGRIGFEVNEEIGFASAYSLSQLFAQAHFLFAELRWHAHGKVQALSIERSEFDRVFARSDVRFGLAIAGHG